MIKAENVQGFNELVEANQNIFVQFLHDFNIAHEPDTREYIEPLSIKACCEVGYGEYLRFDYKYFKNERWVHVKGHPVIWF